MQRLLGSEPLRHEAEFHERMDAALHQSVVNLVDVGKIVDGSAVGVLAVDADFIVKNRVEANVVEPSDLFDVV